MSKEIILSGIQPTGRLHIGNYLGSLKNFIDLQSNHDCFFMIADYHSITENYNPKLKQQQINDLAANFIAAGLDPKKCTIFIQSQIAEHTELAWIFDCVTPISYLERMTQYKDKALRQQENINTGLFTYPVLQAADILIYHATAVPVGVDQDQHVELTRQIAKFFNNRFGQTFAEPKTLHTETPKVMSLLEPDKKMSKSLGDNHCIYLDDEPEVIAKKISRAVTDTGDGKSSGAKNLLDLLNNFSSADVYKKFSADSEKGTLKYSELKKQLANDIGNYFADFRTAKKKIKKSDLDQILADGARRAQKVAQKTMAEVRAKIGIR
ncbi:MAG: tryptophan--tRNA ligase [Patescibacteria group bacterium]|nr:tryptophan--tRNA ligase [Patescibacteria group bacterium]